MKQQERDISGCEETTLVDAVVVGFGWHVYVGKGGDSMRPKGTYAGRGRAEGSLSRG
jgi:hypothetical protein